MEESENRSVNPFFLRKDFVAALAIFSIPLIVFLFELITGIEIPVRGIFPRSFEGIPGILLMPLFHQGASHLFSNLPPLFFLSWAIFHLYPRKGVEITMLILIIGGILVFLLARPSWHIGTSGIVYGMAAFLFVRGIFIRDRAALAMSLLVILVYGNLVWGLLPINPHISWEGHLYSAVAGIAIGWHYRKASPPPAKYEWMNEEDDSEEDNKPYYPGVNQPFKE